MKKPAKKNKASKSPEAERLARVRAAVAKSLDSVTAQRLLELLGQSPLELTPNNCEKAYATFPIPREQLILWASAEFDLRPSGVVVTDAGVFVKTDSCVIAGKEKRAAGLDKSDLHYYKWDIFEPAWFAMDVKDNVALKVAEGFGGYFVGACTELSQRDTARQERLLDAEYTMQISGLPGVLDTALIDSAMTPAAKEARYADMHAAIHNPAGHGEMVEKAINMIDIAEGRKVEWKGPDCAKNGADRVVDGISIQTKYYSSAIGSVDAAFDSKTGLYRYINQDGSPMQLEVPSDQYEAALSRFRAKISAGKVEGVTDPNQAEVILRKGKYTYQQAVNLTKAGTIESLKYDAGTGVVTCMSAFGFSFVAATFMAYRSTGNLSKSVQAGVVAGTQVFGMSFIQHMLASQLSRTTVADAMLVPSQMIVEGMGTKSTQAVVNGLRAIAGKQAIYGAAAAKQLAKTLRGNAVTAAITLAVFSVPQAYNLVANKISRAQFAKNIAVLAGGVAAGAGGAIAAGVAAGKVGAIIGTEVTPVVGTVVGAVGGFVGGTVGSAALGALGGVVKEDDAVVIGRLFNAMIAVLVSEYLLCEKEIDALVNLLNEIDQKELKKLIERVHGAGSQEREIREFLCPIFDEVASKREGFSLPNSDEIAKAIEGLA